MNKGDIMRTVTFLLVFLGLLVQLGCLGSGPRREDFDKADFGSYPTNYQELIQDYLSQVLIDPGSLQNLSSSKPEPMWFQPMFTDPIIYGYGCWFSYGSRRVRSCNHTLLLMMKTEQAGRGKKTGGVNLALTLAR
jgi:hypothetical protein